VRLLDEDLGQGDPVIESYPISEAGYMLGSTAHWARILNGFSGGEPTGFRRRMRLLARLPAEPSVAELRRLGVDVVAVHAADPPSQREAIRRYFSTQPWATVVPLEGSEFLVLLAK
jgi:hypothetical protein